MQQISVCIIVKNEEKVLARCLENIRPWVDEIIIVDTGSTDATVEIAQRFTSKIFSFTWENDFSAARNFSLSKASGDWILWLDADEILPDETGSRLRSLIASASPNIGCYSLTQNTSNSFGVSRVIRQALFRKDPSIFFTGRVHEQIQLHGLTTLQTNLTILHLPDEPTFADMQKKNAFYLDIIREELVSDPTSSGQHFHLALTLEVLGRHAESDAAYATFLNLPSNPRSSWSTAAAFAQAHRISLQTFYLTSPETAALTDEALAEFPEHPEVLKAVGEYYLASARIKEAKQLFSSFIDRRYPDLPDLCQPQTTAYWRFQRLGEAFLANDQPNDARLLFEAMCERFPDAIHIIDGLRNAYGALGETEKAQEMAKKYEKVLKDHHLTVRTDLPDNHIHIIKVGSRAS
jgi:glycosyltransferase involved in cell wall biosynthesis